MRASLVAWSRYHAWDCKGKSDKYDHDTTHWQVLSGTQAAPSSSSCRSWLPRHGHVWSLWRWFRRRCGKTLVLPEPRLLLARVPRGLLAAIPIKAGLPYAWLPILSSEWRFPGRGWWCRFARDGDWGSNGSRGCGWGGKKKDQRRGSFACPCGWGPSGQEVSNQRKPASRTTQPSAAHPKVPKPRKPSLHTGWKWSSPLVHSKLWDWHLRPESDQQGIYHDEGSYARRHVGVLGLQGWSTKPFVASHQEHISRAWKPRGFLSNCSECSLERPQGPPRCGIRLCTTPCRSTWLAGMKHKAFRCFTPRAHIKGLEAQRLLIKLFWMQPWKTPGTTTLWHQTLPSELEKCCPCLSKSAWEPLPARKVGSLRHSWRRSSATLVGWSIHAGTRLRLQPDEEHQRGCVVQIVCASDPSMRKSSLKDFTSKKLLSHADVPAVIKAGGTTCTDATIKGIRASIKEYARAGIISDEIATTICRDIREGDPTLRSASRQQRKDVHLAELRRWQDSHWRWCHGADSLHLRSPSVWTGVALWVCAPADCKHVFQENPCDMANKASDKWPWSAEPVQQRVPDWLLSLNGARGKQPGQRPLFWQVRLARAQEGFAGNLRLLSRESRECRRTNLTDATLCWHRCGSVR